MQNVVDLLGFPGPDLAIFHARNDTPQIWPRFIGRLVRNERYRLNWDEPKLICIHYHGQRRYLQFMFTPSVENILYELERRLGPMRWADWRLMWGHTDLLCLHKYHRLDLSWFELAFHPALEAVDLTLWWRGRVPLENWIGTCFCCGNRKWTFTWNCHSNQVAPDTGKRSIYRLISRCRECMFRFFGTMGFHPATFIHQRYAHEYIDGNLFVADELDGRGIVIHSPLAIENNPFLYLWTAVNEDIPLSVDLEDVEVFQEPEGFDATDPYWSWQPWLMAARQNHV